MSKCFNRLECPPPVYSLTVARDSCGHHSWALTTYTYVAAAFVGKYHSVSILKIMIC
jgi:hypothetical protein